jgi:nitrite reductase/ring-hydroxylating ferredoxin subunit
MLLSSSSRGGAAALRRGSSSTQQQAPVIGRSHRLSSKDNARAATSSSPSPLLLARRRPSPPRVATVVADAPPTTSTSAQPQPTDLQPIDWYKQWYPVAAVDDLLDDRPNAVRVLDLSLVAWRDGAGKWRVAADACPHRLAQLSEGRVEKREGGVKTLACPCEFFFFGFGGLGAVWGQAARSRAFSRRHATASSRHPAPQPLPPPTTPNKNRPRLGV